jgi:hypothetical protein
LEELVSKSTDEEIRKVSRIGVFKKVILNNIKEGEMQIRNRSIRLFVSSTFQDMHEERDALCRFVFPYLEDFCGKRNIGFTGIDLRWGVTEEEVQQKFEEADITKRLRQKNPRNGLDGDV